MVSVAYQESAVAVRESRSKPEPATLELFDEAGRTYQLQADLLRVGSDVEEWYLFSGGRLRLLSERPRRPPRKASH